MSTAGGRQLTPMVYEQLRRSIVHGRLRPNATLSEVELADQLAVSRTPVREALLRLSDDGLVRSERRRWIVHEHTIDEIREAYEIRSALEGKAAALAARRASVEDVDLLMKSLEESAPIEAGVDSSPLVVINHRFHGHVFDCAHNESLRRASESATLYYFNYEVAAMYSLEERTVAARQHRDIAAAIRDHDEVAAQEAASRHVDDAFAMVAEKLASRAGGV